MIPEQFSKPILLSVKDIPLFTICFGLPDVQVTDLVQLHHTFTEERELKMNTFKIKHKSSLPMYFKIVFLISDIETAQNQDTNSSNKTPHQTLPTAGTNNNIIINNKASYSAFIWSLTSEGRVSNTISSTMRPLRFRARQ